ncbi:MAG: hypothetical protein VB130_05795 [Clostridium sp.]|nr:hypothetical protein [Clostridium sp.]
MQIECFFSGIKNANLAVDNLKNSGFHNSIVDLNEHYNLDSNSEQRLPGSETAPNLSGLVLNSGDVDNYRKPSPLAAASPMASGMGNFEELTDINYKVVVETDSDEDKKQIEEILKNCGGDLKDPNLNPYEHIRDIPI